MGEGIIAAFPHHGHRAHIGAHRAAVGGVVGTLTGLLVVLVIAVLLGFQSPPPTVIIDAMNAAERFLAASRARDVEAAASEPAADVVMHNPATDDLTVGRDAVAAGLRAVEAACDEFRHTHLLTETSFEGKPLFGLVFEARIGESTLYGVDIIELDDNDHIISFTVLARPIASLMALGARMAAQISPGAQGTGSG